MTAAKKTRSRQTSTANDIAVLREAVQRLTDYVACLTQAIDELTDQVQWRKQ